MFYTLGWQYPSSGPAPPSPVVVNTVPDYFGGRPTPPPTPPRARATLTVDDYAPCPPTPPCVPSDAVQDQLEWSNTINSGTSQSTSSGAQNYWLTSELNHFTAFADPLMDETSNDSGDQPQYNDPVFDSEPPSVSDYLLHAPETYAYPSPVLSMMQRASLDMYGLETQPVTPFACSEPLRLFSLTGGHTPMTGLHDHDQQSSKYYDKRPYFSPLREPECSLSYRYSVSAIEALQHSLRTNWSLVYPPPIPPVIIRSRDLIGPCDLSRRADGYAFVVPTEDSVWGTTCQRGIDLDFRPLDPSLTVETCVVAKGAAFYYPQHIVAPKFAVNVFLELDDSATSPNPLCEYLGAYVLQVVDGMTINRTIWTDINPEVQQAVYDRVPDCFRVYRHPSLGWPQLPCVRFCYYKWDKHIVGLADESPDPTTLTASQGDEGDDSDGYSDYTDTDSEYFDCDVDQDPATTFNAYSSGQRYMSFMDFWPCE